MKRFKFAAVLVAGSAMLVGGAAFAAPEKADKKAGEAKPATEAKPEVKAADAKPAEAKPSASTAKLTKPWSDLTTLSDDQKAKIEAIHKKSLAESSAIDKKEKEDITAVLTDAQKAELKELTSKKRKETTAKKVADSADKKAEPATK
jgi:Spy/CpxP family protein refolding chaperone